MQAGREVKLRRGALWACAIPIGLGSAGAILFITFFGPGTDFVEMTRNMGLLVPMYIIICLLIIPPLATWITGFRLRFIDDPNKLSQWRSSFGWGLLTATALQLIAAIVFTQLLVLAFDQTYADFGPANNLEVPEGLARANGYRTSFRLNLIMWIALTLPLTTIGATIFHRVTTFPSDRTVF